MTATSAPLLVSGDPGLLDLLDRMAAAAGRAVDVAHGPAQARRWWPSAGVVVVGDDVLPELAQAGLPRRPGVVVVATGDDVPWEQALAAGAERVVHLATDDHQLLRLLSGPGAVVAGASAPVVGVLGGSGGAGASVLATGLALAAVREGLAPLLVDADPSAAGLDLALAAEDVPGARWCDLAEVTGLLDAATLRSALPSAHGAAVLSTDRESSDPLPLDAVPAVLDSARAAYDLVVLDLPRAERTVLDLLLPRCDAVLVVVTTEVRSVAAGRRLIRSLERTASPALVVRTVPHGVLDPTEVEQWLGLRAVADLRHDARLPAALERGEPPGGAARSALARACRGLVRSLVA